MTDLPKTDLNGEIRPTQRPVVSVVVTPDLREEIRRTAEKHGLSLSEYFRALHAEHVRGD